MGVRTAEMLFDPAPCSQSESRPSHGVAHSIVSDVVDAIDGYSTAPRQSKMLGS